MANLVENAGWDSVPEFPAGGPVTGGSTGTLNQAPQALLNRLALLKSALGSSNIGHTSGTLKSKLDAIDALIAGLQFGQNAGVIGYLTKAYMDADLAHPDGTVAYVLNDATASNNTTYKKSGASGTGSWVASTSTSTDLLRSDVLAHFDWSFGVSETDVLAALVDASGREALKVLADGTLLAKLAILAGAGITVTQNADGTYTIASTINIGSAQMVDYGASDYLFAITDASGRISLQIDPDGGLSGKITSSEVVAARGSRASLSDRINQHHNAYGLPKRHVWGEWYLRETRQRLRKRLLAESARLSVALIGDSWTHAATRWSGPFASALKTLYGDGGPGWVGFGFAGAGYTLSNGNVGSDATLSYGGTWTAAYAASTSPDICQVASATAGDTLTVGFTGSGASGVDLFYIAGAGAIQYRWNGGAWNSLSLASGTGLTVAALTGVPAGAWTLELQNVSGTTTLCGVNVKKTTDGVVVHKLGATGSRASQWSGVNATEWQAGLTALAPNLVAVLLATNDQGVYDSATFKGYVQTLVTRIKTAVPLADVLLIIPCENGRANTWPMSDYAAAMYELAATNKCAFMDLQYVFGDSFSEYASTSARAWFAADLIHPDPTTGGRAIVDDVMRLVTQL